MLGRSLVREEAVFWIMIRLFKLRDERSLARIQHVVARHRVARLDAVADIFAPDIDRRGKSVAAERLHIRRLPAVFARLGDHVRLVRPLAAKLHHDPHGVALRHQFVAALGLHEDDFRPRDAVQICRRPKRAQQQRGELPACRRNHRADHTQHRDRVADVAPHELHGEQRLHLHALHFPRHIVLQKRAELLRVEYLALRLPQLHRREQILAQPWFCVLDEPRELPRIRRVKQPSKTLPPSNHEHRRVSRPGQRPAQPIRHPHREIDPRDDEHGE